MPGVDSGGRTEWLRNVVSVLVGSPLSRPSQHFDQDAVLIHPTRRTSAATMHACPLTVLRPTRANDAVAYPLPSKIVILPVTSLHCFSLTAARRRQRLRAVMFAADMRGPQVLHEAASMPQHSTCTCDSVNLRPRSPLLRHRRQRGIGLSVSGSLACGSSIKVD